MGIKAPWLEFYGDVPHSLTYPLCSMTELVEQSASRYPEDISYSFMGRNESYAGFMEGVYRCARAFAAIGVKAEDRIMLCLPNVPQALECFYAVNLLGAVAVMVHPLSSEGELKFYIENSKPSAVVTLDQFYDKFDNISSAVRLPVLIVTGVKNAGRNYEAGVYSEGGAYERPPETETVIGWERFLEGGDSYRSEHRTPGGGSPCGHSLRRKHAGTTRELCHKPEF